MIEGSKEEQLILLLESFAQLALEQIYFKGVVAIRDVERTHSLAYLRSFVGVIWQSTLVEGLLLHLHGHNSADIPC